MRPRRPPRTERGIGHGERARDADGRFGRRAARRPPERAARGAAADPGSWLSGFLTSLGPRARDAGEALSRDRLRRARRGRIRRAQGYRRLSHGAARTRPVGGRAGGLRHAAVPPGRPRLGLDPELGSRHRSGHARPDPLLYLDLGTLPGPCVPRAAQPAAVAEVLVHRLLPPAGAAAAVLAARRRRALAAVVAPHRADPRRGRSASTAQRRERHPPVSRQLHRAGPPAARALRAGADLAARPGAAGAASGAPLKPRASA